MFRQWELGQWGKERANEKKETQEDVTAKKQTQQRLCTFRSLQGERAWERNGLHYYRTGEHKHSTTLREDGGGLSAEGREPQAAAAAAAGEVTRANE